MYKLHAVNEKFDNADNCFFLFSKRHLIFFICQPSTFPLLTFLQLVTKSLSLSVVAKGNIVSLHEILEEGTETDN